MSEIPLDSEGLQVDSPSGITTRTGRRVDPLNASPGDISIHDIAPALARQVRYNGHVTHHLSVARHSLWVADRVAGPPHWEDPQVEMTALLHDAAEAYMGDLVKPLKHSEFGQAYLAAEARLEQVIAVAFDLIYPMPDVIKESDRIVTVEHELGAGVRWTWNTTYQQDEGDFLARYYTLRSMR